MKAFEGAVAVGAHALETDIHLSKDDVVVLSHVSIAFPRLTRIARERTDRLNEQDPDLKRCFGDSLAIVKCDWSYLAQLRTLKAPHEPMPRLSTLLEYLSHPDRSDIWALLDIKIDNDADKVMRLIASTIQAAPQPNHRPWNKRIVLGIWAAKYLPLCKKYLPDFPISHIGFNIPYARQFLKAPNVSFNMWQHALTFPLGRSFIRQVHDAKRPIFAWTVNDDNVMKWCIQRDLDGVITDDPKKFNEICKQWRGIGEPKYDLTIKQWFHSLWIWFMVFFVIRPRVMKPFPETVKDMLMVENVAEKEDEA
jgi:glycerophosphoryl diester phosphodiesterase